VKTHTSTTEYNHEKLMEQNEDEDPADPQLLLEAQVDTLFDKYDRLYNAILYKFIETTLNDGNEQ